MSGCIARCEFTTSRVMNVYATASSMYKQRNGSGKNRRQSGLSLPGWKNCRRLLLMQSEVQIPLWSSVLG